MEVKVSTKYQIVIPKEVRRKLHIRPGQKITIKLNSSGGASLNPPLTAEDYVKKYAGMLKDTPWKKEGIDAAVWLRRQRDTEWD